MRLVLDDPLKVGSQNPASRQQTAPHELCRQRLVRSTVDANADHSCFQVLEELSVQPWQPSVAANILRHHWLVHIGAHPPHNGLCCISNRYGASSKLPLKSKRARIHVQRIVDGTETNQQATSTFISHNSNELRIAKSLPVPGLDGFENAPRHLRARIAQGSESGTLPELLNDDLELIDWLGILLVKILSRCSLVYLGRLMISKLACLKVVANLQSGPGRIHLSSLADFAANSKSSPKTACQPR